MLTGFREAVFHAVPVSLKVAISVGIGLFIAFIGFVDAGFVRRTATGPVPVELGVGGTLGGWPTLVFVVRADAHGGADGAARAGRASSSGSSRRPCWP